jgi:hypothetical protein
MQIPAYYGIPQAYLLSPYAALATGYKKTDQAPIQIQFNTGLNVLQTPS